MEGKLGIPKRLRFELYAPRKRVISEKNRGRTVEHRAAAVLDVIRDPIFLGQHAAYVKVAGSRD